MKDNSVPIVVGRNMVLLSTRYLGTAEAYVWVGWGTGPQDNSDHRVQETRALMKKYYPYVPYGMMVGNYDHTDTFNAPLIDDLASGYYGLRLDHWPEGVHRLNYHGPPNKRSPSGFPLTSERDGHVSWARWYSETPERVIATVRDFIYREPNGAGLCFRILIDRDRTIKPFGNLDIHS